MEGKGFKVQFQGSVSRFRIRVSSVLPLDVTCDSQDLTLHTMLSDGVAIDRLLQGLISTVKQPKDRVVGMLLRRVWRLKIRPPSRQITRS
jgi:hypothetical protein